MTDDVFDLVGELTDEGEFIFLHHYKIYQRRLAGLIGKKLRVQFSILREKRSDGQNRYMWGVIVKYVQQWLKDTQGEDHTPDEVYTWLRVGVLQEKPEITEIMGREIIQMKGKRFSQMSTKEFAEATNIIIDHFAKLDLHIPLPEGDNRLDNFFKS